MDQEERCMTYGHTPTLTRDYARTYDPITREIVQSKRRKKMYVCDRCGARDIG